MSNPYIKPEYPGCEIAASLLPSLSDRSVAKAQGRKVEKLRLVYLRRGFKEPNDWLEWNL